jgi:hypothetical protein
MPVPSRYVTCAIMTKQPTTAAGSTTQRENYVD